MMKTKPRVALLIIIASILFCACNYRAGLNKYVVLDENTVQQFESEFSVDTMVGDSRICISNEVQRACTDEEMQMASYTVDLFFEELLRYNFALRKPTWNDLSSLSDELHQMDRLQEEYTAIDEYVTGHGADLNITSFKITSTTCLDRGDMSIIRITGVLCYRLLSFDGIKPSFLIDLSFGDNPIAFAVYVRQFSNNKPASKVIGWSFIRYDSIQVDFYPEVIQ